MYATPEVNASGNRLIQRWLLAAVVSLAPPSDTEAPTFAAAARAEIADSGSSPTR